MPTNGTGTISGTGGTAVRESAQSDAWGLTSWLGRQAVKTKPGEGIEIEGEGAEREPFSCGDQRKPSGELNGSRHEADT